MSSRLYIGVPEVAARYGVSEWTVYDACRRGRLPHRKVSGMRGLRFLADEFDALDDGAELEARELSDGGRVVRPLDYGRRP